MATIFCFSSTGNSLYVSKKIAEKIDAKVVSMSEPCEKCDDDVIGFIFPAFFWGVPKVVEKFILELTIEKKNENESPYIFAICTYGGKVYGITGELKKILKRKELTLNYGRNIKSVENYIPIYKVNNMEKIHNKTDIEIEKYADEISIKKENKIERYTFINKIVNSFYPAKHSDCDKYFSVSPECAGCGVCENICPVNNIKVENKTPAFLHNCELCLACIHACPVKAMEWKQSTKGKERYRNPHISSNELISFCGKK